MIASNGKPEKHTDGFAIIPHHVFDMLPQIGRAAFLVFCALMRFADSKTGKCWPSMSTLAARTLMSKSTVVRALTTLESHQLIIKEKRNKTNGSTASNCYCIQPVGEGVTSVPPPPLDPVTSVPTGCHQRTGEGVTSVPEQEPKLNNTQRTTNGRTLRYDDDDMKLVKWMWKLVEAIPGNEDGEPDFNDWANEIRISRERDGKQKGTRTHKELCEVFKWANEDNFWRGEIRSPEKLRKKFNKLNMKRLSQKGTTNGKPQDQYKSRVQPDPEKYANMGNT